MIRIILAVLLIAAALTIWDARTATTEKITSGYIDSATGKTVITEQSTIHPEN